MLSVRNLLEHRVDELARELHSLDQYLSNERPGRLNSPGPLCPAMKNCRHCVKGLKEVMRTDAI